MPGVRSLSCIPSTRVSPRAETIDDGMTGVDTSFFVERAEAQQPQRDEIRERYKIRGKAVIFSGGLTARKGIREMLAGFDALYRNGFDEELTLVLAGEGAEEEAVRSWKSPSAKLHVELPGFLQIDDLPGLYLAGDLFVLPTLEDNWALATLEPLLCGTPSLVSKYNGAASDLEGEGAAVFDPKDPENFATALRRGLENGARLSAGRVRELADYYHPEQQGARAANSVLKSLGLPA